MNFYLSLSLVHVARLQMLIPCFWSVQHRQKWETLSRQSYSQTSLFARANIAGFNQSKVCGEKSRQLLIFRRDLPILRAIKSPGLGSRYMMHSVNNVLSFLLIHLLSLTISRPRQAPPLFPVAARFSSRSTSSTSSRFSPGEASSLNPDWSICVTLQKYVYTWIYALKAAGNLYLIVHKILRYILNAYARFRRLFSVLCIFFTALQRFEWIYLF